MFRIQGRKTDKKAPLPSVAGKRITIYPDSHPSSKDPEAELTPNHIRNTRIDLLAPSKEVGEFIKESKKIIEIFQKDCDIIIYSLEQDKILPQRVMQKRFQSLKNFREKLMRAIIGTAKHSREEKEVKQLINIASVIHKDIRQLMILASNIKQEKRLDKILDKNTPPHVHNREELMGILEKRGERIINHLYHYSPLVQDNPSIEENLLAHDLDIYKKIYSSLILAHSKGKIFSEEEEKKLLTHVYKFSQQVRNALYYLLGQLPKDLHYEHEKHYIEKPSPILNDLQKCPITGILGEKKDFDVHHLKKQSHIYGSMKENITYVLKDFHVFYHAITDHKELEEPLIRIKNILSIQQGLSKEEFTKTSSPLLKLEALILEKRNTLPGKATSKLGQLVSAEWKLASSIHRLHLLPNPTGTKGETLYTLCKETMEIIHKHLATYVGKYGQSSKKGDKITAVKQIENYLYAPKAEKRIGQKELIQALSLFKEQSQEKLHDGFHANHPLIAEEELGWYAISIYKTFCEAIRNLLMDSPYLLERKLLYRLHLLLDTFQNEFINLIGHIQSIPPEKNSGGYHSKLCSIVQKEEELYAFITSRLFFDSKELTDLEKNTGFSETIKIFFTREKENIPTYLKKYREKILHNGIPNTLLYNIHILHKEEHEKKNGTFQLHSLGNAQKEKGQRD